MNRDHKKRKSPEAKAIAKAVEETKPDLTLDLHNFFRNYEYAILRRPIHDFCPAFSTNAKIKPETMRISYKICEIAIEAVRGAGGTAGGSERVMAFLLWSSFNAQRESSGDVLFIELRHSFCDLRGCWRLPFVFKENAGGKETA